jgi:snRNA-activating protein complex subunit 3
VYNPVTWAHGYLSRASQHTVLSSQTLGDLLEVISCPLNELGKEIVRDDCIVGYENQHVSDREYGGVICIEGIAYGDGQDPDYAEQAISFELERS